MAGQALALWFLLGANLVASQTPAGPPPYRFVEQIPLEARSDVVIDGVSRPVLPRDQTVQRFALPPSPGTQLSFAVGLRPEGFPAAVRFDAVLQTPDGKLVPIFQKTLTDPGWSEERIDLSGRDLGGAHLMLGRSAAGSNRAALAESAWGNPMLLAATPARRPAVILISIDTLRADFVGAYGREPARTHALDGLARAGVLYEQAYSPSTWTVPSHASMLYGLNLPETPYVLRQRGLLPQEAAIPERPLATILSGAGYVTAGFTGGGFMFHPFDLPRGFDTYFGFSHLKLAPGQCPPERLDGAAVFAGAQRWLEANGGRPFFLFVHTYDAHDRCPFENGRPAFGDIPEMSDEQRRRVIDFYDQRIADTDARIAALLARLDELGLRDTTLVIATADHGEAYGEHGNRGHGKGMVPYEEIARVPLIARLPSRIPTGERIAQPVSVIDIAPTILALLGLPAEPWMRGAPLPGLGLTGAPPPDRPVFVHSGDALAVRRGAYKLITSREGTRPDELYDVQRDPAERNKLGAGDPALARLRADAAEFWRTAVGAPVTATTPIDELDEGTKERLRMLGYVE